MNFPLFGLDKKCGFDMMRKEVFCCWSQRYVSGTTQILDGTRRQDTSYSTYWRWAVLAFSRPVVAGSQPVVTRKRFQLSWVGWAPRGVLIIPQKAHGNRSIRCRAIDPAPFTAW